MLYAITCLDDDPLILKMLELQLRRFIKNDKIVFEFFSNPEIALKEIGLMPQKKVTPIILITDFRMPEQNGSEVIRELKKINASVKCIILSGEANAIQVDDLVNEDLLTAFIQKPWDESELAAEILPIMDQMNFI
jgi:response regulator RpfG family c-di-GMP phosphodiesterase